MPLWQGNRFSGMLKPLSLYSYMYRKIGSFSKLGRITQSTTSVRGETEGILDNQIERQLCTCFLTGTRITFNMAATTERWCELWAGKSVILPSVTHNTRSFCTRKVSFSSKIFSLFRLKLSRTMRLHDKPSRPQEQMCFLKNLHRFCCKNPVAYAVCFLLHQSTKEK